MMSYFSMSAQAFYNYSSFFFVLYFNYNDLECIGISRVSWMGISDMSLDLCMKSLDRKLYLDRLVNFMLSLKNYLRTRIFLVKSSMDSD